MTVYCFAPDFKDKLTTGFVVFGRMLVLAEGFGVGVGGAAYAGGDQALIQCNLSCGNNGSTCGNQNGNWPGGGGMSSHSRTSWSQPGSGAPGLILMSYC